jgi:hypothetical protein
MPAGGITARWLSLQYQQLTRKEHTMIVYDNYEISPCQRFEEPDSPGKYYFEVCLPEQADVWTLYGHFPEGGVEAIGDFYRREAAEQVYSRITGLPTYV